MKYWRSLDEYDYWVLRVTVSEIADELFEEWRDDPGEIAARDMAWQLYMAVCDRDGIEAICQIDFERDPERLTLVRPEGATR